MKRNAEIAKVDDRAYIQQPVSCQFCRSRKLKCDRSRPSCFNCSSRSKECVYEADKKGIAARPGPAALSPVRNADHSRSAASLTLSQRVERLEQAVFAAQQLQTEQDAPHARLPSPSRPAADPRFHTHDEQQQRTSQWLEGLLNPLAMGDDETGGLPESELSTILRDFPSVRDAEILLEHFTTTIDATYRTLHVPTTWGLLNQLYSDLQSGTKPSATRLAHFLTIFAGSAFISKEPFVFESTVLQNRPRMRLAELWGRQALSLATNPPLPPSTEALQTMMTLGHMFHQMEGVGSSFSLLYACSVQMARILKIHRLDSPSAKEERRKNGADSIDLETKRRTWWHMVASDWLLSYFGGPNEGTYTLHPRQMEVMHPANVDDEDIPSGITFGDESYDLPRSSPTSISYFLHRIEAATLAREVVDTLSPSFFTSTGTESVTKEYDTIISLDAKYQSFFRSLPFFFQLEIEDTEAYQKLLRDRPYLEWQRYLINFAVHTQLARLHRPFLIRGTKESKYAYSRTQCIRSAEIVIDIQNRTIGSHIIGSFTYVLHHFFTALMTLVMDVCYNPDESSASRRKQDALHACRALEEQLQQKVLPPNHSGVNDASRSQPLVHCFQSTVQQLRSLLRRGARGTGASGGEASSASYNLIPTAEQQKLNANTTAPVFPPSQNSELNGSGGKVANMEDYHVNFGQEFDNSELAIDGLWDDFLTIGPTFTVADWDNFFHDIGTKIP